MVPATGGEGPAPKLEPIDPATKEALLLLFSPEGSFVQDLLLTELVRAVEALSRQAIAEVWSSFAMSIRIPLPAALRAPGSWPLLLPGLVLGLSPTARLTEEDVKSLETVRRVSALLKPQVRQQSSLADIFEFVQDGFPFFRNLLPGVATSGHKFFMLLLQRQALRLADDLEAANIKTGCSSHVEDAVRWNTTSILPAPVLIQKDTLLEDKFEETTMLQLEGKDELHETIILQLEGRDSLKGATVLQLEGARQW